MSLDKTYFDFTRDVLVAPADLRVGDIVREHGTFFWVASAPHRWFQHHDGETRPVWTSHAIAVGDRIERGFFRPGSDWTLQGSKHRMFRIVNRGAET